MPNIKTRSSASNKKAVVAPSKASESSKPPKKRTPQPSTKPTASKKVKVSHQVPDSRKLSAREKAQLKADKANAALALVIESEEHGEEELDQDQAPDSEEESLPSSEAIDPDANNEEEDVVVLDVRSNEVLTEISRSLREVFTRLDRLEGITAPPLSTPSHSHERLFNELHEQEAVEEAMSRPYPTPAQRLLGVGDPINAAREAYPSWPQPDQRSHLPSRQSLGELFQRANLSRHSCDLFCSITGRSQQDDASSLRSLVPDHVSGALSALSSVERERLTILIRQFLPSKGHSLSDRRPLTARDSTSSFPSSSSSSSRIAMGATYVAPSGPGRSSVPSSFGRLNHTTGGALEDRLDADENAPQAPVGFGCADWTATPSNHDFFKVNNSLLSGSSTSFPKNLMVSDNKYSNILFFIAVGVGSYADRLSSSSSIDFSILYDYQTELGSRAAARNNYGVNYAVTTRLLAASYHVCLADMALSDFADLLESSDVAANAIDVVGTPDLKVRSKSELTALPSPRDIPQFKVWATNQIHWFGLIYGSTVAELWKSFLDEICLCAMNTAAVRYRIDLSTLLKWWNTALTSVQSSLHIQVNKILSVLRNDPSAFGPLTSTQNLQLAVVSLTSDYPEQFSNAWFTLDPRMSAPMGIYQRLHNEADASMVLAQKNLVVDHQASARQSQSDPTPAPTSGDHTWRVDDSLISSLKKSGTKIPALLREKSVINLVDNYGKPLCLRHLLHQDCPMNPCSRSHQINKNRLSNQWKFFVAVMGGSLPGESMDSIPERTKAVNRYFADAKNWHKTSSRKGSEEKGTTAGGNLSLPHPLEGPLIHLLAAHRKQWQPDWLALEPSSPKRTFDLKGTPSSFAVASRALREELFIAFPGLKSILVLPHLPQVISVMCHHRETTPSLPLDVTLMVSLNALASSILPGSKECAARCYPRVLSRTALFLKGDVRGVVRAICPLGNPILQSFRQSRMDEVKCQFGPLPLVFTDLGETAAINGITMNHQCVLLVLARMANVSCEVLLTSFLASAEEVTRHWPPSMLLNNTQQEILKLQHHLHHPSRGFHDMHLVRYFGSSLFHNVRVILIVASASGLSSEVQVIQAQNWNHDKKGKTFVACIYSNHCMLLSVLPLSISFTRRLRHQGGVAQSLSEQEGNKFLAICCQIGVHPSILYHVDNPSNAVELHPMFASRKIKRCSLPMCAECLSHFPLTSAGKVLPPPILPQVISLSAQTDPNPSNLRNSDHMCKPVAVQQWFEDMVSCDGLSPTTAAKVGQHRSQNYLDHVVQTIDTLPQVVSSAALKKASCLRDTAKQSFSSLDRVLLKKKDKCQLALVSSSISRLRALGDDVMSSSSDLRSGLAAIRLATAKSDPGLPLQEDRLASLDGLIPREKLKILGHLSKAGVPLWDMHPPKIVGQKSKPHASAIEASIDMAYTVIRDIANGNAVILSKASQDLLDASDTKYFSQGAVEKKGVDGKPNGQFRPISDAREHNAEIERSLDERSKLTTARAPPAVCSRMTDIIRLVVILCLKYPGMHILFFKKDIDDAFKKIMLNYADAPSWASILASMDGVDGETILLPLSLMFGGQHCPGWFGTAAWSIMEAWHNCGPSDPSLNGCGGGEGTCHVDDLIAVGPRIGSRMEVMAEVMTHLCQVVLGPHAINSVKDLEEGTPSSVCKVLGFVFDLTLVKDFGPKSGLISIPVEKVEKLAAMLSDEFLDGVAIRNVKLKDHQKVQGLIQWFASVSKHMNLMLADLYPLSCHPVDGGPLIRLSGDAMSVSATWKRYLETLELVRVLCDDMQTFQSSLTSSLCQSLLPQDQVALNMPHLFCSSDATLAVSAAIDYESNEWFAFDVREMLIQLKLELKPEEERVRVAWSEMLPVIWSVMRNGNIYRGKLIFWATDNVEVEAAVNKKAMQDPVMRKLQALLVRLELEHGLEVRACYVNTKNNVLADDISRLFLSLSPTEMQRHIDLQYPGLRYVSVDNEVDHTLKLILQPFTVLDATTSPALHAKAMARWSLSCTATHLLNAEEVNKSDTLTLLPPHGEFHAVVINGGIGQVTAALKAVGGKCVEVIEPCEPLRGLALSRGNMAEQSAGDLPKADLVWLDAWLPSRSSFSEIQSSFRSAIQRHNPPLVVCLLRLGSDNSASELTEMLVEMGYAVGSQVIKTADLHCPVQSDRLLLRGELGGGLDSSPDAGLKELPLAKVPGGMKRLRHYLVPLNEIPWSTWKGGRALGSAPPVSSQQGKPPLAGYWRCGRNQYPVQSIDNAAEPWRAYNRCIHGGVGRMMIYDDRDLSYPGIRPLLFKEVCKVSGIPPRVSENLLDICSSAKEDPCFWVGSSISFALASVVSLACAARLKQMDSPPSCADSLGLSSRAGGGPSRVIRSVNYQTVAPDLRASVYTLVESSIGENTRTTYFSSFKHWLAYRQMRSQPWQLSGSPEDEMGLVEFIAFKGLFQRYRWSSIHVMLFAIRFFHLRNFLGDPLYGKIMVKVAMKGLKRIQGGPVRKVPATMEMLKVVASRLNLEKWNDLVLLTSIMFMFIFLLRSREVVGKHDADPKQCVRVSMVRFFKDGVELFGDQVQRADELCWMSAYSKTDPNGQGGSLNVFRVLENPLCVVNLLLRMHSMNPYHFGRGNSFLFSYSSGRVVHRDHVVKVLASAALSLGIPKEAVSVISLRSGGATAMYEAGFTIDDIKKRGRWASECWRIYVWEGNDRARNIARDMLNAKVNVRASLAYYLRHAPAPPSR